MFPLWPYVNNVQSAIIVIMIIDNLVAQWLLDLNCAEWLCTIDTSQIDLAISL